MSSTIVVKALGPGDIASVARVHRAAFVDNALSKLGPDVVERHYVCLHEGPFELFAVGAFDGARLLGFCYGGMLRGEISYFLARNRALLARRLLLRPWLLRDRIFRNRLRAGFRLLRRPEETGRRPEEVADASLRSFGILSIAVDPAAQRGGVGKRLLDAAEEAARAGKYQRMHLTVHRDNAPAIAFYERNGWSKVIVNGAWNASMRKIL